MMFLVKVSTIIPAYNAEGYIQEAIESVLSQTYKDIELIVVDDGSTDSTAEAVKNFSLKVEYMRHAKNMGPAAARNTGIRQAKGEYIAFLDADDVWMPTKIEEQIKLFESNKDLSLVYSNCYAINRSGRALGVLFNPVKLHRGRVFEKLLLDSFITTSSVVIKKQVLNAIGMFDERFLVSQDFDLYLRIAERYNINFVDRPLFKYRLNSDSLSSKKRRVMLEEAIKITVFYRDKIGSENTDLASKLDRAIAKYMFYIAIWSLDHAKRRDAIREYFECIKTMSFDWKIALGSIFFIMPKFISVPLKKNLIKIRNC